MGQIITLSDAKVVLKVTGAAHDARITQLVEALSDFAERYTNHVFVLRAGVTERHSGSLTRDALYLKTIPVETITSIHDDPEGVFGASTLVDPLDYFLASSKAGVVRLTGMKTGKREFLAGIANVKVVFTAGYSAIPDAAKEFVRQAIAHLFRTEEARAQGVTNMGKGDSNVSFSFNAIPPDVLALLEPFKMQAVS